MHHYRVLCIYDVENLYEWVWQEANNLRSINDLLGRSYSAEEMTYRWFRYNLRRFSYINLAWDYADSERNSELHNLFLINLPRAYTMLYHACPSPPEGLDQHEAHMRLTGRRLTLEYCLPLHQSNNHGHTPC